METSLYHPLPRKAFEGLASKQGKNYVSIYLPMHKKGKEQNQHLDQANLKHCIKEVKKALSEYQFSKQESDNYLKPVQQLDGLAIFLDSKGLVYYTIPIPFKTQTYVADHFYLKPMFPLYSENGHYYILELSMDHVKLHEASKYGLEEIYIEDFAPDKLEEAVGYDYRPKMLQFRSGQAPHGAGSFHGYDEGKDDEKKEILSYFNAIDKGLNQILKTSKAPLVLACIDKLYPIYKQANSYPHLYDKSIDGNPELLNKDQLHKASWQLIQSYFEQYKNNKLARFKEFYHTPKTTFEVKNTVDAAVNGRIDTLFIVENTDLYGTYNNANKRLTIDEQKNVDNASLINLCAMHTFKNGGNVFLLNPNVMPVKGEPLNALLRY